MSCPDCNNQWWSGWFLGLLLGLLVGQCTCSIKGAQAECLQYTVQKGDSLKKVAKEYYGHKKYWLDIKYQNELKRNRLKPGQELYLYIPEETEWFSACNSIIIQRLAEKGYSERYSEAGDILFGLKQAFRTLDLNALEKLEMCRWAVTTAEQESMYIFSVGSAGEIGMFQTLLDTARLTLAEYNIGFEDDNGKTMKPPTDRQLVTLLLDNKFATFIFALHFHSLREQRGSLYLAWYRYNGFGEHAKLYADKAIRRYYEIRRIQPLYCKKEEKTEGE